MVRLRLGHDQRCAGWLFKVRDARNSMYALHAIVYVPSFLEVMVRHVGSACMLGRDVTAIVTSSSKKARRCGTVTICKL